MSKSASGIAFVRLTRGMTVERRSATNVQVHEHGALTVVQQLPDSTSTEVWAAGAWESCVFTERVNA